ncbi:MAG: hydroxymethylbilane synthase [Desulfurococcales archaeon]|nr:hydroxymethylbilane synthase [Desulfurococcales archaeon]
MKIRIAARPSKLSLIQVDIVVRELEDKMGPIDYEIIKIKSHGDIHHKSPFEKIGVTGIFEKNVNRAVLEGKADIAVHSLKDLPSTIDPRLTISYVTNRGDPRDALVSANDNLVSKIEDVPPGSVVGTSSARRKSLLLYHNPGLIIKSVRGNIDTRLSKLGAGYDYIVTSAAALDRIKYNYPFTRLPLKDFPPSPGQGFIAVTSLKSNPITDVLRELVDPSQYIIAIAEREFLRELGGGCNIPLGGHCYLEENKSICFGVVLSHDGFVLSYAEAAGERGNVVSVASRVARILKEGWKF